VSHQPTVSVVVPHYEDLAGLEFCLAALARQTYPGSKIQIIVSDNASPAGEAAVKRVVAGRAVLVIANERGAGPARNVGVEAASGEILAFTDADCVPEPGWLLSGVAALDEYDVVGGRVAVLVDDKEHITAAEAFEQEFGFENDRYVAKKGFSVTANLFCRRSLFQQVGGFRTGVSEDYDWCARAVKAGFRIGYADTAVVGHPARKTWAALVSKWRRINSETFALMSEGRFGKARWLLRTWALPLSAIVQTPRVLTSRRNPRLSQRMLALLTLYRLRLWRFGHSHRILTGRDGR
jgi:GT2 family glycosyltransferase